MNFRSVKMPKARGRKKRGSYVLKVSLSAPSITKVRCQEVEKGIHRLIEECGLRGVVYSTVKYVPIKQ